MFFLDGSLVSSFCSCCCLSAILVVIGGFGHDYREGHLCNIHHFLQLVYSVNLDMQQWVSFKILAEERQSGRMAGQNGVLV